MAFKYIDKTHFSSIDPATLQLLEQIDEFPYALIQPRYESLGDLHNTLTVELVDNAGHKTITLQRTIGDIKKRVAKLQEDEKRTRELQKKIAQEKLRRHEQILDKDFPPFEHQKELDGA